MKPLPLLLLAAFLAGGALQSATATPRGAPDIGSRTVGTPAHSAGTTPALLGAPLVPDGNQPVRGEVRESAVGWYHYPDPVPGGAPPTAPAAEGGVGTALMAGNIGWAEPDLGIDYLATRFPRGTLVKICGPNACLVRRTNDYGPVASIRPNRIADLAVLDWEYICGLPRTRGLCPGTVETVAEIRLPPTDTEDSWTP